MTILEGKPSISHGWQARNLGDVSRIPIGGYFPNIKVVCAGISGGMESSMSVNGINNVTQSYANSNTSKAKSIKSEETKQNKAEEAAVVYEKSEGTSESSKKIYQKDTVTIERLKADAEKRTQGLRDLVKKMMLQQGETFDDSTDMYKLLREGKVQVDEETRAQAAKDVAEDGYWGVNQTSDRMVSFAKALSGGDTNKANELIDAVKKGFEEATKAWGGELPEISKRTMDATISKLESWRDGKDTAS